jgi:hypothetical protein
MSKEVHKDSKIIGYIETGIDGKHWLRMRVIVFEAMKTNQTRDFSYQVSSSSLWEKQPGKRLLAHRYGGTLGSSMSEHKRVYRV